MRPYERIANSRELQRRVYSGLGLTDQARDPDLVDLNRIFELDHRVKQYRLQGYSPAMAMEKALGY